MNQNENVNIGKDDRAKYAEVWIIQLKEGIQCRGCRDYTGFFDIIDTLIPSLFKPEREKAREYLETLQGNKLDQYTMLFEYIIDLLQEKGYLSKEDHYPVGGGIKHD